LIDIPNLFSYFKTIFEVSTPIPLKTNNKKLNYVIVRRHICGYSTWKQTYLYTVVY